MIWWQCVVIMMLPMRGLRAMPALFLSKKKSRILNVLSIGINHPNYFQKKENTDVKKNNKIMTIQEKSIHAEEMAIDKIKNSTKKKQTSVSLLVIRISENSTEHSYKLCNSKPCAACIHKIMNTNNSAYRISKIYFSNEIGDIVCFKIGEILAEANHITRFHRKNVTNNILSKKT